MEVVEGLADLNFSEAVALKINQVLLNHLCDHGFDLAARVVMVEVIEEEVRATIKKYQPKIPHELGAHIQHRLPYWQQTRRRTPEAVTLYTARVLSRTESDKIFFILRNLSHALMGIVDNTPLYNNTRPT